MNSREVQSQPSPVIGPNGAGSPPSAADAERERTGPRKRYVFGTLAALVILALLFFGIKWFLYARVHETTDDAHVDANVVSITSKIGERVKRILVDTDQPVRKGELLIVLDSADERARAQQAQANLQLAIQTQQAATEQGLGGVTQADASVGGAAAGVTQAQAEVLAARAQVRAAQAQVPAAAQALAKAAADLQRAQSLVATGDLPREQLDAARAAQAQAASQYRAAHDGVNVALANLNAAQERVATAQAAVGAAQGGVTEARGKLSQAQAPSQIAAARAALDIAEQNVAYTQIRAPISGYIGERNVEVGQTVQAGMALLTEIPDSVFVTADYKETQTGDMRPGQEVDIHVDAYKGVTFHGRVLSINPAAQNTYALVPAQNSTGNFVKVTQRIPVKISIDDADPKRYPMRPGMSVETSVKVR